MAVYDLRQQRLCVRVVYDGPAGAGKTTNVQQLADLFAPQAAAARPRWDHDHQDLFGRTLTFDWEQLNAGVAGGLPLQCQIVSVPGQLALVPRRRALLASADVIVYVCDASAEELPQTRRGLALIEELAAERTSPPLVLQVNKQDGPNALSPDETARLLGLSEHTVVGAIAVSGQGVMDTFIAAVRAVGQSFQAAIDRGPMRVPLRAAERPTDLAETLEALPLDVEDAAEMMLEEMVNRFTDEGGVSFAPLPAPVELAPPVLPESSPPAGFVWPPILGRAILGTLSAALASAKTTGSLRWREDRVRVVLGPWSASTSRAQRYGTEESARLAMAALARSLPSPENDEVDIVIALSIAADGGAWLWTLEHAPNAVGAARPFP